MGNGGKSVCGLRYLLQDSPCLFYSLGSDADTSFEEHILASTACEIHTYDPTLSTEKQTTVRTSVPDLHFHSVGLGRSSGPLQSLDGGGIHSLKDVMAALGHEWVDVLKIDIEGHEWDLFLDIFDSGAHLPASQPLVEVHWRGSAGTVWKVMDAILADGYRTFSVEPNYYCWDGGCARDLLESAFIRVSEDGHLCTPRLKHRLPAGC
ncbi:g11282 [Coccomyxa elongata]